MGTLGVGSSGSLCWVTVLGHWCGAIGVGLLGVGSLSGALEWGHDVGSLLWGHCCGVSGVGSLCWVIGVGSLVWGG